EREGARGLVLPDFPASSQVSDWIIRTRIRVEESLCPIVQQCNLRVSQDTSAAAGCSGGGRPPQDRPDGPRASQRGAPGRTVPARVAAHVGRPGSPTPME